MLDHKVFLKATKKVKSFHSKSLTANVRSAFKDGYDTTYGVLDWFNDRLISYNETSLKRVVRRERQKIGLQTQTNTNTNTRCKGITANIRHAMNDGCLTMETVLWHFAKHNIQYKRSSVRRILNRELKKLKMGSQSKQVRSLI